MGDRLKDKVALVSGAGSSGPGWGNGKATAVLFAREGAKGAGALQQFDLGEDERRGRGASRELTPRSLAHHHSIQKIPGVK